MLAIEQHDWGTFRTPDARATFGAEVTRRLSLLPGVESAALMSALPLAPGIGDEGARVWRANVTDEIEVHAVVATSDAFRALGVAIGSGRAFETRDVASSEPVVILSEAAASRMFPEGAGALDRFLCGVGSRDAVTMTAVLQVIGLVAALAA